MTVVRARVPGIAAGAALALLTTLTAVPAVALDDPVRLTFLDINDFHGRINASTLLWAGTVERERALAEAAGSPTAFLSAGDNIGASEFASAVQGDQPTIDVLDALDLDASAVGNHEFDQGYADLVDRVIAGGTNAEFPYLGANVLDAGGAPALQEYAMLDMGGVAVAVIGAVTQETPSLVSPGGIAGLTFSDPVEAVNDVAARLTDGDAGNGEADVIVAAYHEGAAQGEPPSSLGQELARGGAFAAIVEDTSPAVDVILTAHTHQRYAWTQTLVDGTVRPVVQTGSYGDNVGRTQVTYDPATDTVSDVSVATVPRIPVPAGATPAETAANQARIEADLIATYPRVAAVDPVVDAALAYATEVGSVPIGSVAADITTAFTGGSYTGPGGTYVGPGPQPTTGRDDRAAESTLGNLVADALLATLAEPRLGGAQIGVVNPGGLRAELLYAPDGVLTYAEANGVLPFVNNLWTTTLTGAQVKTLLEQQWQRDAAGNVPSRPYLQLGLSTNVSYTFDASRPEGDRITSITVNGAPIDPAADYRVGSFSFLLQGGDNFWVAAQGRDTLDSGLIDRDAWIAYLSAHPGVAPDFAKRSVAVPAVGTVTTGQRLVVPVSGLDLTSLGSPANTSLEVRLGSTVLGSVPVSGGAASVDLAVPRSVPAGASTLTLVAAPSGTTVTVPVTVQAGPVGTATTLLSTRTEQRQSVLLPTVLLAHVTQQDGRLPRGSVEFRDGGTLVARTPVVLGLTLMLVHRPSIGVHTYTATFVPDSAEVTGSTSSPVTLTVRR